MGLIAFIFMGLQVNPHIKITNKQAKKHVFFALFAWLYAIYSTKL